MFNLDWLLALLGAIVGAIIGFYIRALGDVPTKVYYFISRDEQIWTSSNRGAERFELSFNGRSVVDVRRTVILLWNGGPGSVGDDFSLHDPPMVKYPQGIRILSAEVVKWTSPTCRISLDILPEEASQALLKMSAGAWMSSGDGVAIEVIYEDIRSNKEEDSRPFLQGSMKDASGGFSDATDGGSRYLIQLNSVAKWLWRATVLVWPIFIAILLLLGLEAFGLIDFQYGSRESLGYATAVSGILAYSLPIALVGIAGLTDRLARIDGITIPAALRAPPAGRPKSEGL